MVLGELPLLVTPLAPSESGSTAPVLAVVTGLLVAGLLAWGAFTLRSRLRGRLDDREP